MKNLHCLQLSVEKRVKYFKGALSSVNPDIMLMSLVLMD